MRRAAFLLAALAAASLVRAEEANACPRWIAVLPLNKGNAASIAKDAAALGEETFVDGIAWLCALHPEGTPPTDKGAIYAALYRESAESLRKLSSVKQGVLLQSTIGHGGWPPPSPAPFQLAVPPDKTSKTWRVCPLDRAFLDYIARTCQTLNELKPDFFMVDDDTRLIWSPTAPGCFCDGFFHCFAFSVGIHYNFPFCISCRASYYLNKTCSRTQKSDFVCI